MRSKIAIFHLSLAWLIAGCCPLLAAGESIDTGTKTRILEALKSSDAELRSTAIHTVHYLGEPALKEYSRILGQARVHHEKRLYRLLQRPFKEHHEHAAFLDQERERIYPLIMTTYDKDPGKIAMLRREMRSLSRPFKNTLREAKKDPEQDLIEINERLDILRQIHFELMGLEQGSATEEWSLSSRGGINPELERLDILDETLGGQDFMEQHRRFKQSQKEALLIKNVELHNKRVDSWATGTMKSFTSLLNEQRAFLGLCPMALEQCLSEASLGHSLDMIAGGFFAHISPVPGKKTPEDRARLANFDHAWTGENLFAGSPSPQAAYDAWFASDGHRFIMMGQGSNLIGIGQAQSHWTLMTGARR